MAKRELASRLQAAEAAFVGSYLSAGAALAGRSRAETRRIEGVVCLTVRDVDSDYLNRTLGVGTIAEATPSLLDRIERHYARIGRSARLAIATGHVSAATIRALERRGYVPDPEHHTELVYVYDRPRAPLALEVEGLTIERVRRADARLYARIGDESFNERGPMFAKIVETIVRRRRDVRAYLGRIDGEPAATGMLMDAGPVGALGNGSVRPRFRGRGIQRAMIAHRLRDGWERGFRVFFAETGNPASAHNMEALGWRKVYDEVDWVRRTA